MERNMEKKIKVGIYTFIAADNYGAVLQAYALKQFLCDQGYEAHCVDYRPDYLAEKCRPFSSKRLSSKIAGKGLLRNFVKEIFLYRVLQKRHLRFEEFRQKKLSLLPIDEENIDCYIVGSDQVWNYSITHGDRHFMGDIPNVASCVIAYAASMEARLAEDQMEKFRKQLENFKSISVREDNLKCFLKSAFGQDSELVVDPTFLLSAKEWLQVSVPYRDYDNDYIFMYGFGFTEQTKKAVRVFANKCGLKIVLLTASIKLKREYCNDISPEQFVYLVGHAKYVVTNSFHGTAFSIILGKKFIELPHPSLKKNIRVENLLELSGIRSQYTDVFTGISSSDFTHVSSYSSKLLDIIESSKNYLLRNIV